MLSLSALSTAFTGPPKPRPKAPPARMHATLPGVKDPSPYTIYSGYLDAGVPPSGRGKMYDPNPNPNRSPNPNPNPNPIATPAPTQS